MLNELGAKMRLPTNNSPHFYVNTAQTCKLYESEKITCEQSHFPFQNHKTLITTNTEWTKNNVYAKKHVYRNTILTLAIISMYHQLHNLFDLYCNYVHILLMRITLALISWLNLKS